MANEFQIDLLPISCAKGISGIAGKIYVMLLYPVYQVLSLILIINGVGKVSLINHLDVTR